MVVSEGYLKNDSSQNTRSAWPVNLNTSSQPSQNSQNKKFLWRHLSLAPSIFLFHIIYLKMFIEIIWIPIVHVESSHWFNWHLISNVKKSRANSSKKLLPLPLSLLSDIVLSNHRSVLYFVVKGASDSYPTRYYATHPKSLDKLLSYLSLFCHFRSRHFLDQWTIIQFGK